MASPSAISLNDVLCLYPEIRKSPALWLPSHLEFVGCQFELVKKRSKAVSLHSGLSQDTERYARGLRRGICKRDKLYAMEALLDCPPEITERTRRGISFYYGHRRVHRSPCTVFSEYAQESNIARPYVGYINYSSIECQRKVSNFRPPPQVPDGKWFHDPYLLCVLLSLAQYERRRSSSAPKQSYTTRLIVVHGGQCVKDAAFLTAEISLQLLESIDSPNLLTSPALWPTIRVKGIRFKPYQTFKQRLFTEISAPDSVGHDGGGNIDHGVGNNPAADGIQGCSSEYIQAGNVGESALAFDGVR